MPTRKGKRVRSREQRSPFKYVRKVLEHKVPGPCLHQEPCGLVPNSGCACSVNRTKCFADCGCDKNTCSRLSPGCDCPGGCDRRCPCRLISFDCIPGRCTCQDCSNVGIARKGPLLRVDISSIPLAGSGLFATATIRRNDYIGEYSGEMVEDAEYVERAFEGDSVMNSPQMLMRRILQDLGEVISSPYSWP
jgi:hypothetical protein